MGLGRPLVAFPKPRTTTGVGTITTTVTVTDCVLPSLPLSISLLLRFLLRCPQRRGGFRLFHTVFEQPIKSQLVGEINVDSVVQLSLSLSSFSFHLSPSLSESPFPSFQGRSSFRSSEGFPLQTGPPVELCSRFLRVQGSSRCATMSSLVNRCAAAPSALCSTRLFADSYMILRSAFRIDLSIFLSFFLFFFLFFFFSFQ